MSREFSKPFYKSKRWEEKRAYILMRDRYKCQVCGCAKNLEVHHIIHLSPDNIDNVDITLNESNLKTLCRDCHFNEHKRDRYEANKKGACGEEYYFDEEGNLQQRAPDLK